MTKKGYSSKYILALAVTTAGLGLARPQLASASTYYWNTTTTSLWSTGGNWSNNAVSGGTTGTVPTSTDSVVFNQSSVNGNEIVQLSGAQSVAGMTFANNGTTLLESSSATPQTLTLSSGITVNSGAGAVTLGNSGNPMALALSASQSFTNNASTLLTIANGVTSSSGSNTLTVAGTGTGGQTFAGVIGNGGGTIALTVNAANSTTLSNANTYTGATTVSSGTLTISGSIGGGATGTAITVGAVNGVSATLTEGAVNSITGTTTSITLSGGTGSIGYDTVILSKANNFGGAVTLGNNANAVLTLSDPNAMASSSGLSATAGTINLLSNSTGNFTIASVNTSAGTATINVDDLDGITTGQTLTITGLLTPRSNGSVNFTAGHNYTLGLTGITLNNTAAQSSTLNVVSGHVTVGTITSIAAGATTISLAGGTTDFVTGIISNGSGTVGVSSNGVSVWTLSNANSYSGATTITLGAINLTNSSALGSTTGVTVASNGALQLSSGVTISSAPLNISGSGLAMLPFNGALESVSGSNAYNGAITLGAAASIGVDSGSTLTINSGTITGAFALTLTGAGTGTLSSIVGNSTGGIIKSGTGTWTLNGGAVNTYTGATAVNAGTLLLDFSNLATPTNLINSTSTLTLGGGILSVKGKSSGTTAQTLGAVAMTANTGSGITLNPNSGTSTTLTLGTITRGGNSTLNIDISAGGTVTDAGTAPGTTNGLLTVAYATVKDATGVGFANYTGGAFVRNTTFTALAAGSNTSTTNFSTNPTGASTTGSPYLAMSGSFSANSLTIDTSSATGANFLDLGGGTMTLTSKGLLMTGANNFTIQNGVVGSAGTETIIHQMGSGILTINGTVGSTSGILTKDGSGTLVLGGANTYTGTTAVDGGTLQIGASGTVIPATNTLAVSSAGTFDLNGYNVTQGTVTNNGTITNSNNAAAATLTVGNGSTLLTGTGNFTTSNSATMNIIWNNNSGSASTFNGNFSNTGTITFNANSNGSITAGGVINNAGTITNSGTGSGTTNLGSGGAGTIGSAVTSITQNSTTSELSINSYDNINFSGPIYILAGELTTGGSSNTSSQDTKQYGTGTITLGAVSGTAPATLGIGNGQGGSNISNPLTVQSGSSGQLALRYDSTSGAATFTGPITLVSNPTLYIQGGAGFTVNGGITGTGNIIFGGTGGSDAGVNTTTLSGIVNNTGTITNANAGTGATTISAILGSNITGVTENSPTSALVISGNTNTYGGVTKVLAGALEYTGNSNSGTPLGTSAVQVGDTSGVNSAFLITSGFGGNSGGTITNTITVPSGSAGGVVIGEMGPGNTSGGFTFSGPITLNRSIWLANGLTGGGGGAFSNNITDATANGSAAVSLITGNGVSGAVLQNITGTGNTWSGGTTVDGGVWSVGSSSALGTGNVTVNAGDLRLSASTNLGSGKTVTVNTGGFLGLTGIFNPTSSGTGATNQLTASSSGALGIDVNNYNIALNMANVGNGLMFLGGSQAFTSMTNGYTATSLGVGSGNIYRLGGGGGLVASATTNSFGLRISGTNNVLTGTAAVVVGSTLANAPYTKGNGWVVLGAAALGNANNYSGGTTVNFASGLEGVAVGTSGGTTTEVTTSPFGLITSSVGGNITLNGGTLQLDQSASGQSITPIGNVTFDGSSTLAVSNTGLFATTLEVNGATGLTRSNNGVLVIQGFNSHLGAAAVTTTATTASENVLVTATGGNNPTVVNSIVQPYYVDPNGNFLTYGANGFAAFAATTLPTTPTTATVNYTATGATAIAQSDAVNSLEVGAFAVTGAFTLTVGNATNNLAGVSFNGTGSIGTTTLAFGASEGLIYVAANKNGTISSNITGSNGTSGLTKSGPGTLILSSASANTFTGQVTVNQGLLQISNDNELGSTSNTLFINGGTVAFATNAGLAAGRTITIGSNGATIQVGPNNGSSDAIASTIGGTAPFMVFNTSGTNIQSYTFTVSGTNTFTAPVYIDELNGTNNLTVSISADANLGTATNTVNISAGATLQATSTFASASRPFNFSNQGGKIDVSNASNITYTIGGIISGDGNLTKLSSGAGVGTLELTAANTLVGSTIITGGNVLLSNANALQFSTVGEGAANGLVFNSTVTPHAFTIGGLGGSANQTLLDNGTNPVTLTVGNNNANINYTGALSGTLGALTKIGTGTQTLSGANTYTGPTTIQAGTLALTGAGSIANTTNIIVGQTNGSGAIFDVSGLTSTFHLQSGQTLSGHGNVNGNVIANAGSSFTPGGSIGTTTYNNGLDLSAATAGTPITLNYTLGTPGTAIPPTANGAIGSLMAVTGLLVLPTAGSSLTLNLIDNAGANSQGTLGNGFYELFSYGTLSGGTGTSNETSLFNIALVGHTYTVTNDTVHDQIDLTVASSTTPTTYTLAASPSTLNILLGGKLTGSSTITNTGTGTADTLNYTGLSGTTGNGSVATVSGSSNGGPLANNSVGTASQTLTINGVGYGSTTVTSSVTGATNATIGGAATFNGPAGAINVVVGNATAYSANGISDAIGFGPALSSNISSLSDLNGLASTVTATTGPGTGAAALGTAAMILKGVSGTAPTSVSMAWRTRSAAETLGNPAASGFALYSDVVQVGFTGNVPEYILEMTWSFAVPYTSAEIGQYNVGSSTWQIAGTMNVGAVSDPTSLALGSYGYDTTTHDLFVVLSQSGDFAVIPEPASLSLLALGAVGLLSRRRRR